MGHTGGRIPAVGRRRLERGRRDDPALLGAGLVLLPFVFRLKPFPVGRLGWRRSLLLTGMIGAPYSLILVGGAAFAPAIHSAVISPGLIPLMSALQAYLFLGEPSSKTRLRGHRNRHCRHCDVLVRGGDRCRSARRCVARRSAVRPRCDSVGGLRAAGQAVEDRCDRGHDDHLHPVAPDDAALGVNPAVASDGMRASRRWCCR